LYTHNGLRNIALCADFVTSDWHVVSWLPTNIGDPYDYTNEIMTLDGAPPIQDSNNWIKTGTCFYITQFDAPPYQLLKVENDFSGYTIITIEAADQESQDVLDGGVFDFHYSETDNELYFTGGLVGSPSYFGILGLSGVPSWSIQMGDVIKLGCWSPCPIVGLYRSF
jgi:hypothetical protein